MNNNTKTFLITGTSRGIGQHLALYFLNLGHNVIGCSRSSSTIENHLYKHFQLDLANELEILEMFKSIRKDYKSISVLINNAAINPAIIMAALLPYETISNTFKVNVLATMLCTREGIKLMLKNKFGRVINLGSMASKHEVPGESLYTSTKSAINAYTRVVAKEVAKMGITVNVVAPSAIETELSNQINRDALNEVLSRNAINELGNFNDVSNIIDTLIKPESSAITGQIIYLGGV
jgi:3-oxoacyl-[acyl-carrier protein] reductase